MTRARAIAAKCRDCTFDRNAAGQWTAQVACCTCIECPLWGYRPVPRTAPDWIKSRNPGDLPEGWRTLPHETAVRSITASPTHSSGTRAPIPATGVAQ